MAFEGEYGAGDRTETAPATGSRVMFTEPKLLGARPVVWSSVVTSFPEEGIRRRSEAERYSRRTWYRKTSAREEEGRRRVRSDEAER